MKIKQMNGNHRFNFYDASHPREQSHFIKKNLFIKSLLDAVTKLEKYKNEILEKNITNIQNR
jgi:hypothetical protein